MLFTNMSTDNRIKKPPGSPFLRVKLEASSFISLHRENQLYLLYGQFASLRITQYQLPIHHSAISKRQL
jgi:hypothetical protein